MVSVYVVRVGWSSQDLPVSCDVAHEQDAGVHVEIEGRGSKVTVNLANEDGAIGIVHDSHGETEAEQEVSSCQILQVDGHTAGCLLLSSAEINSQGEAIQEQTHLQRKHQGDRNCVYGPAFFTGIRSSSN